MNMPTREGDADAGEMLHQQSWIDKTKNQKTLEFLAEVMQEDQAVRTVPERSRIRPDHPSHHGGTGKWTFGSKEYHSPCYRRGSRIADRGPCHLGVATVGGMVLLLHMEQDQGKPSLARRQFLT